MTLLASERNALSALPDWITPGVVISYRGGTERVLVISETRIETVAANGFVSWDAFGFRAAVADGDVTHRPDGARIHRTSPPQTHWSSRDPSSQTTDFMPLFAQIGSQGDPRAAILKWMLAVSAGEPAQPWQHVLGITLVGLGAEVSGLGNDAAARRKRGPVSESQREAQATQALIARLIEFLAGGDPITRAEWTWLRTLVERGMVVAGLMPGPKGRMRGRPSGNAPTARAVQRIAGIPRLPDMRGLLARKIRESAEAIVLERLRIAAAWCNQDHRQVTLASSEQADTMVEDEIAKIERLFYQTRSRRALRTP